ncbi:hypothetical protein PYW07_005960 [Mythimna separata]|uniref:MADF domain-containing protein n=1 Tax=Mythimna separata TaxID=271217 RepID=A0AAD7YKD4_MYTSE|nr:hypothetical protein PYW07_005960 [Mythimna separata]
MERIFIECVKKHPCLWQTDCADYKISDKKDKAWKKVIEESEVSENGIKTVKEAKYFWKKLRDIHRQSLSKQRRVAGTKKWKHQEHMEFLLPYLKRIDDGGNSTVDSDLLKDDTENDFPDDTSDSPTPKQPRKIENIFVSSYSREDSDSSTVERHQFRDRRAVEASSDPQRPALESFFSSMCEMTSALPEYIQMRVERKIFDVVMEAREEHLQNQAYFGS